MDLDIPKPSKQTGFGEICSSGYSYIPLFYLGSSEIYLEIDKEHLEEVYVEWSHQRL